MTIPANLSTALCAAMPIPGEGGAAPAAWIHLLPAGQITTVDGRGPYRVEDMQGVIRLSMHGGARLPIDENHATDFAAPRGDPAPARGWIIALQARRDGLWGQVEWTDEGRRLVADRAYRHISPAILYRKDGTIMGVLRASLVNRPNLIGLTALHQQESQMDLLTQLKSLLGLPDDADAASVLAEIGNLKMAGHSAGAPDPAKYVPIGEFVRVTQELNRVHNGIELQAAKLHVEEQVRTGKLLPFMRDWGVSLCTANKPAFDQFISQAGTMIARSIGPSGASALPPSFGGRAGALADTDAHVASVLGLTTEAFKNAGGN
ncbi:phage protease [Methylobacterium sp. Leaf85]|uniref:phage protease n=1 Tax=Methylobacterium sp. Leaf85 TaxID=1736241 RepID=UPI0006FEB33A|nr:phage protease [Methylobacterium sp. Leaf85]KQO53052.1 hypothetical protein ASF08_19195 [Methylobacterium sp. Leaf85]